jgi:hypothetical protein
MEELFRIFEKKAGALESLASLVEATAGKKLQGAALDKCKKTAAELARQIESLDNETRQKLISTALLASLPAVQWAKMENSIHKKPWFETTYDGVLDKSVIDKYLSGSKGRAGISEAEKELLAAGALMLYKTSRCMATFNWSKKTQSYSENYRLGHSILMHFINEYDAALHKKIGDELDRYYAGRYYGAAGT